MIQSSTPNPTVKKGYLLKINGSGMPKGVRSEQSILKLSYDSLCMQFERGTGMVHSPLKILNIKGYV